MVLAVALATLVLAYGCEPLVVQGTELPATGGEEDLTFSPNDSLELVVVGQADIEALVYVGERKGGGKVVHNQVHALPGGEARVILGAFKPNPYVVRVAADGILVRNLTFSVK